MKRVFSTIFLFMALFTTISAQDFIDTLKLNKAYNKLLSDTQSLEKQKEYFNAFPNNWAEFYDTYKYCSNEDYDLSMYSRAYEHIQALGGCTAINDTIFCNKLIALSVGATLDADAPNYLQGVLHNTMKRNNDTFMHCLSKIDKGHQMQFWQFYWSSIISGRSQQDEFNELYNKNKEKYPTMMKAMSTAFEYFNNGVLFMGDFNDFINSK